MNADPEYDARLRERLELLRKKFEEGKVSMMPELASKLEASLRAVRADASGQIDLSTVDSSVRALALGIEHLDWRDQVKKTQSIRDVQELYFQFIHSEFSGMYGRIVAQRPEWSMSEAARFLASDSERRDYVCKILPEFIESIRQFWRKAAADAVTFHLQDFSGLKTVFGGDLFPVVEDSFISTSAIYTDTVVVPDPFLQTAMYSRVSMTI